MSRRGYSESSRSQASQNVAKPLLKTVYKNRGNGSPYDSKWINDSQINKRSSSQSFNGGYDQEEDRRKFDNTSSSLMKTNFKHHDPNLCVCEDCNCRRHLCKLHVVAPDMSKSSIYRDSYKKKGAMPNLILKTGDAPKLRGDHLDLSSVQKRDFDGKTSDAPEKHRPEDLLKSGGPCPGITSYSSGFPGFKGDNQYVKPLSNSVRGKLPLKADTTYGKSFTQRAGSKAPIEKTPDNLKPTALWMGSTTYGDKFGAPNPEDYAAKIKIGEKLEKNPNFGHQYETVYKNDFLKTGDMVCPAKKKLETKIKGQMSGSKGKFIENSDFKAFSPDFHALSLAKQSFV